MHPCVYSPLILTCLKDEKPPPNLGKALGTHRSLASSLKYTATGRFPRRQTPPEEQLHGAFPPLAPHVSDRFEDGSEEFLSHGDNARNRRSLSSCVFYLGVERGDLWHQRLNLMPLAPGRQPEPCSVGGAGRGRPSPSRNGEAAEEDAVRSQTTGRSALQAHAAAGLCLPAFPCVLSPHLPFLTKHVA